MARPCQRWHERCRELFCSDPRAWQDADMRAKSQNPHPFDSAQGRLCRTNRDKDGAPLIPGAAASWIFTRKTKRPRLDLSLGTSVDQPSPKCCSIANVFLTPDRVNSSSVPDMARTGSMDNCMKVRGFSDAPAFPPKIDGYRVLENNGPAKISTHATRTHDPKS
jgi:hypothetical protein